MRRLDPSELFELDPDRPELEQPVLIQALDGFIDAGGGKRLAREHLLASYESQVVARFDVDQLLDYRARRPAMLFVEDHWESYSDPELAVYLLHDAVGTPFLLLAGPEPDVQWERFVEAVRMVVDRLGVQLTIGLNAIPMGVPHTRPTGVIAHGSRKELVAGYEPWVNAVQVPGTAGHLIEYRLGQAGYDALGFAVHVPHYVAQAEYPAAAAALLAEVSKASGLTLPLDALEEAAATTRAAIDEPVEGSPEVAAVVQALENQYDAFVSGREASLLVDESELPTADELGAELERFLAEQSQDPPQ
jgi:predicted ATP-grasp superfamily ATP-dependent carboligase